MTVRIMTPEEQAEMERQTRELYREIDAALNDPARVTKPPLTTAQRQELWRQRKAQQAEAWRDALEQIRDAKTLRDARKIATEALDQ